jgi:2-polyprenyl-3-methyl-5-hydroxy-6-metoxy-1,4-benzoquinol methylase
MEERHWWFLARRDILGQLLDCVVPRSRGTLIVDVGCGTGGLTHHFAKDYSAIGVDPAADAIRFATKRFPEVRFVRGEAPQDVMEDFHQADVILLVEVLEHIKDDRAFVHDLIVAMKPGAYLFLLAPADPSLWSPHDEAFEHFRRYTMESFRALWKGERVEERLVSHLNARLLPLIKCVRWWNRKKGKASGQGGTDIEVPMAPVNGLLRRIFAGEAGRLCAVLTGKRAQGYAEGVSVMAILQKK